MNESTPSSEGALPSPAKRLSGLSLGVIVGQWLVVGGLAYYTTNSLGSALLLATLAAGFSSLLLRRPATVPLTAQHHTGAESSKALAALRTLLQTPVSAPHAKAPVIPEDEDQLIEQAYAAIARFHLLLIAVDDIQMPLVILNPNGQIHSANYAGRRLFKDLSSSGAIPLINEQTEALGGQDISPLLQQAGIQLTQLKAKEAQRHEFTVGGKSLVVSISCLAASGAQKTPYFITSWQDASEHIHMRQQVQSIVNAARQGDLSQRIDVLKADGFFIDLSQDINALLNICDQLIGDTRTLLQAISQGNLTSDIQGQYQGRFAELQHDANDTMGKLTQVMNDIQLGVSSLSSAATELAQTNNGLAQRTEEQAAGIEQTAATLEQMTASVKQSADHAQMANSNATQVRERITQTQAVVGETIEAMGSINQASNKILSIIGLINDLSFQTNLLALNAAVEAARAGEQGRGFAVVATEVRNLAERSASAAKEIKHLIEDSAHQVQQGTESVNRSSEAMAEVVTSVSGVTGLIEEIALASQEQANGIGQINQALARLEATTQQNASMVQQTRSASESTGQQAHQLKEMMAFFTVK